MAAEHQWTENDKKDFRAECGLLIRKARKRRGLNQTRVAEMVGISRATFGFIELGQQVLAIDVAWRIAIALRAPLTSLCPKPMSKGDCAR
ncbi:MAG TPA: helix-turn-helix transcriptional regulator [Reyranella sp.]|nr:helix-turn-helix transcriptional regulator [Reyranella sp.]